MCKAAGITIVVCFSLSSAGSTWLADIYLSTSSDNNADVRVLVLSFLPIAAAFMFFDAAQVAANQLLRGLKDVDIPMVLTGIRYWVVGFPMAWYLGLHTDFGAVGVWYGLLISLAVASVLLGARLIYLLRDGQKVLSE